MIWIEAEHVTDEVVFDGRVYKTGRTQHVGGGAAPSGRLGRGRTGRVLIRDVLVRFIFTLVAELILSAKGEDVLDAPGRSACTAQLSTRNVGYRGAVLGLLYLGTEERVRRIG